MNIFFLDRDPRRAARMLCDKHVPKMLLESVQILCTVSFLRGKPAPYRATHTKHPCVQWANETRKNWEWLWNHADAIDDEYRLRFDKEHKSYQTLVWCYAYGNKPLIDHMTAPAQAMPTQYTLCGEGIRSAVDDAVKAYRAYYKGEKAKFAKWERGTPAPEWWTARA